MVNWWIGVTIRVLCGTAVVAFFWAINGAHLDALSVVAGGLSTASLDVLDALLPQKYKRNP